MTSARSGVAKKQEKIAWIIGRDGLGFGHGIDLSSIGATQTAWSAARRGGGANETDTGNQHDVITGSSLDIGRPRIGDLISGYLVSRCFFGWAALSQSQ